MDAGALEALPGPSAQEVAAELDELGFGSLWCREAYGREAFTGAQALLAATRRMVVGTGIATIYARGAMATNGATRLIESLAPGRFVLGLGVSHQPPVERDRKETYLPPVQAMTDYLDDLDAAPYFGADAVHAARSCSPRSARRCSAWPGTAPPAPTPTW